MFLIVHLYLTRIYVFYKAVYLKPEKKDFLDPKFNFGQEIEAL